MFITTQKEEFSYAYISAVASVAGYSFQIAPRPLIWLGLMSQLPDLSHQVLDEE
ncbi:hypothetical protein [Nostoc commune]|uniref:hypothetical protein n=1 Tax=Nostoc commune TaxID=1178 RepID=UPI001E48164E|nr:hypothetical protein [Nostoc commune]